LAKEGRSKGVKERTPKGIQVMRMVYLETT
jgi:hypothetical protein